MPSRDEQPPFIRYVAQHGFALDLWRSEGAARSGSPPGSATRLAGCSHRRRRTCGQRCVRGPARKALRRPRAARHPAGHECRVAQLPSSRERLAGLIRGSAREQAWGPYAHRRRGRVRPHWRADVVCRPGFLVRSQCSLPACLQHPRRRGSVRLDFVEADRATGTVYVLGTTKASRSIAHSGSVEYLRERLRHTRPTTPTFVDDYIADADRLWDRLANSLWTRRHTDAVVKHLWGEAPAKTKAVLKDSARHPGYHLPSLWLMSLMRRARFGGSVTGSTTTPKRANAVTAPTG